MLAFDVPTGNNATGVRICVTASGMAIPDAGSAASSTWTNRGFVLDSTRTLDDDTPAPSSTSPTTGGRSTTSTVSMCSPGIATAGAAPGVPNRSHRLPLRPTLTNRVLVAHAIFASTAASMILLPLSPLAAHHGSCASTQRRSTHWFVRLELGPAAVCVVKAFRPSASAQTGQACHVVSVHRR
ncbi:hypothetical protein BD413DRAFT_22924 [Trametes elegans]|nr:hypothetical protein BD413DRAFT_22924 [Trametes elegans]